MNKIFKFWLWEINIKTKKLDANEKIGYLTNALIKELQASNRSIEVSPNFGTLRVWVHNLTKEKAYVQLEGKDWELKIKPTFDKF